MKVMGKQVQDCCRGDDDSCRGDEGAGEPSQFEYVNHFRLCFMTKVAAPSLSESGLPPEKTFKHTPK